MSIRLYAKYFKKAYLAYENHYAYLYRSNPNELKKKKAKIKESPNYRMWTSIDVINWDVMVKSRMLPI